MSEQPDTQLYCAYHPGRPANLRCNRCGNPICTQCAVLTPVGYRCRTCVRAQQRVFETARWFDFALAFVISAVLAGLGSLVIGLVGFFIFLVAPAIGVGIAGILQRVLRGHRSRYMPIAAGVGAAFGCLPQALLPLLGGLLSLIFGGGLGGVAGSLLALLFPLAYAVLLISALVASLRGIRL